MIKYYNPTDIGILFLAFCQPAMPSLDSRQPIGAVNRISLYDLCTNKCVFCHPIIIEEFLNVYELLTELNGISAKLLLLSQLVMYI